MTPERRAYARNHGTWFDIRADGIGTICIRAVTAVEALEEAAERWHMDVADLSNCSIRELTE